MTMHHSYDDEPRGRRLVETGLVGALILVVALGMRQMALPDEPAGPAASDSATTTASASGSLRPKVSGSAAPASSPGARATAGSGSAIVAGTADRTSIYVRATYAVDLAVRFSDGAVRMDTVATITNTSGGPIDRVEFNTVAPRLGDMELYRVSVDGAIVEPTVADQTITVPLGGILPEDASTAVRIGYHATLSRSTSGSNWFFTRANGVINLYRAIPWVSRPHPFDRNNHGDPFVTPLAPRVTLKLTTDRPMTVAINARRTSASSDGKIQQFVAQDVRGLPIAMSPDYQARSATVGSVTIQAHTRPGGLPAATLLTRATQSLERMQELLGPYPWRQLVVAESAGGYAMEGPGTVWIPAGTGAAQLPYLVAHEVAHQWVPGIVGSDQWLDPFADEALADMVARYTLDDRRASRCEEQRLDGPITRYSNACYYEVIYIQGGNLLDELRQRIGNDAYWDALRDYIEERRFRFGSSRALLDALDEASSVDVAAIAAPRFPSRY